MREDMVVGLLLLIQVECGIEVVEEGVVPTATIELGDLVGLVVV